jgi:hypothetical protein
LRNVEKMFLLRAAWSVATFRWRDCKAPLKTEIGVVCFFSSGGAAKTALLKARTVRKLVDNFMFAT